MFCILSLIHQNLRQFHASKSCVSEVKLCFRNSQIPYLKVNSIFKKLFVLTYYVRVSLAIICSFLRSLIITPEQTMTYIANKSTFISYYDHIIVQAILQEIDVRL